MTNALQSLTEHEALSRKLVKILFAIQVEILLDNQFLILVQLF